ncbi:ComF family protein [Rhodopirellula sp. MGV]|uniref:ComF family protein n=1 Tax=Rhodopirellula sp. MGV TaxID=2023130 RepID=UPI00210199A0|nr:phosphoribosyltransferase family protein [Rhodopirellula sp. MGV]
MRHHRAWQPLETLISGEWWQDALGLLLPPTCKFCDQCVCVGKDFCDRCENFFQASEQIMRTSCDRCGRPGAAATAAESGHSSNHSPQSTATDSPQVDSSSRSDAREIGCLACRGQRLQFDRCVAMWTYQDLIRDVVVASKYGSRLPLADALGRRLGSLLERQFLLSPCPELPDLVTSVPSHVFRRMARGVGGSRMIALAAHQTLHKTWNQLSFRDCLTTTRRIQKQAWLGEHERAENIRGAFRVTTPGWRSRKRPYLSGKHVLLVDDVMTTGSTANEIAKTLKQAGAERVTVAVLARAVGLA